MVVLEMELGQFAEENILEEKLFIVPTRAVGVLMINDMAKKGASALNLNPITIEKLSQDICQRYVEENDILIIDDILGKSLILDCLKSLAKEEDFFFKEKLIDGNTAEEVYKVIMELKSKQIDVFPEEKDLDRIYKMYISKLEELNAMDYFDIMIKAREVKELSLFKDKMIAVAGNIEFHDLERELFQEINKDAVKIKMPVKKLIDSPKEYFFKENPESIDLDRQICFFSEYGISNEIKYIIDDIYEKEIPLDELVISYTDRKYIESINLEFQKSGLGISFAEGLDILSSTSYSFIKTIFSFAENYYNISEIKAIFFNGSLKIEEDKEIKASSIYDELVKSKIFYARENYSKLKSIDLRLDGQEKLKREWMRDFFEDLMLALPEKEVEFKKHIKRLAYLIKKYVKTLSKYDKASMEAILATLKKMEDVPLKVERDEFFHIVLSYIEQISIERSGASPSKAFACRYNIAAYSGREHLYLIGFDSDSLDSKIVESPILLDNTKRDISTSLSFSKENYRYKEYKIREALTADFKNISIGYSNFDMVDVKAKTPSKIYTELKEEYGNTVFSKDEGERLMARDLVSSGTSLEILGQCSRKLYLKNRLLLEEKEEIDVNLDRWLDPLTKGNLVHKVLSDYFDQAKEKRIEGNLLVILEKELKKVEKEIPYILEEVYRREKEEIKTYCKKIIEREKNNGLDVFINELSFGQGKKNEIFGPLEKQRVDIASFILTITGAIDRVDVSMDKKTFKIVDYKTGNIKNFDKRLRKTQGRGKNKTYDYSQGQKFQFLIYKKVLENIIRENEDFKDFSIESFSYEFEDDTIDLNFNQEFIEEIEERIRELLDIDIFKKDKEIVYDEKDSLTCKYCEFKNICKTDSLKIEEEVEV